MVGESYKELLKQAEELMRRVDEAKRIEMQSAIATCKELIKEFGLSPYDLGYVKTQVVPAHKAKKGDATFGAKPVKAVSPPKYRDPDTGATWSGRGHQPHWIVGNRDEYLIDAA